MTETPKELMEDLTPIKPSFGALSEDVPMSFFEARSFTPPNSIDERYLRTEPMDRIAIQRTLGPGFVKIPIYPLFEIEFADSPMQLHQAARQYGTATRRSLNVRPLSRLIDGTAGGFDIRYSWDVRRARELGLGEFDKFLHEHCHAWVFIHSMNIGKLLICDFPTVLKLDERQRGHSESGPAIAYADGTEIYAWHGVRMEKRHIERKFDYVSILAEQNAEVRRSMVELYGMENYLRDANAKPWSIDPCGTLWFVPMDPKERMEETMFQQSLARFPGARTLDVRRRNAMAVVEVKNSTPEPDGSIKTYFLRVPPWVRSPRQGIAWTFGLEEREYKPEAES